MKLECRHLSKFFGEGVKATRAIEDISYESQQFFKSDFYFVICSM